MPDLNLTCPRCGGWDDIGLRVEHYPRCKRSRLNRDGSRNLSYPFEPGPARALIVEVALHRGDTRAVGRQDREGGLETRGAA